MKQPIAVYYASWLPIEGFIIHFSLIEQTIQNSVRKVHWLKIGINLEDMNPNSDATSVEPNEGSDTRSNKNQTDHVEFKSLAHISNAVGKLIHMDENEWVDLHAVS